jgi:hypothetical protein
MLGQGRSVGVTKDGGELELTILMPCLNEAATVGRCVTKALAFLSEQDVAGEVLVADNGSSDGSRGLASAAGARVVAVEARGYGSALRGGMAAARGTFVIMGDADDSYDFSALQPLLEKLRQGYDLVMGNRFQGGIRPGAMRPLHRYLGNPVLSGLGRLLFGSPVGDFHSGLRGFRRDAVLALGLRASGMEFASEMVVKATINGLRICEVPVVLHPDGRGRPPHLRSWRDGWRHLRFMLLYSPRWLFLYPGIALMTVGLAVVLWLLPGPQQVGSVTLDVHTLFFACMAVIVGFQAVIFAVFTKVFGVTEGLLPEDARLGRLFRHVTLETGLLAGGLLIAIALGASAYALGTWSARSFGALDPVQTLRVVIPAGTSLALGCQIVLSSFFLSILGLERH